MRFASRPAVFVVPALMTLIPAAGRAGDVVIADAYASYFQRGKVKFDGVQNVAIAYRSSFDRSDPALAWADGEGRAGGLVSPLNDFSKADGFDIWAVAAGPQSVLVAGVVQAGERALRLPPQHVILTYGVDGILRRKWMVNPWHYHEIAVDRSGSVYALGHRIDGVHGANLVRKFTRDGVVERELFPSDLAPNVEAMSPDRGNNQFWVEGNLLRVYLADVDELFEFDLDGRLQRRASLRASLARLARENGGVRANVMNMTGDGRSTSVLAQVTIWTKGDEDMSFALVRLFLDGRHAQTLESADGVELTTSFFPLLGRVGNDVLFLNRYAATLLRR